MSSQQKIVDLSTLIPKIKIFKEKNQKIVFTNGCFDLLHIGHVSYLEEAKSLGDVLIVGINDDQSVQRLKGKDRPIQPCDNRMGTIAGLQSVDFVLPFEQDTPLALITSIIPDILVKGGDWAIDQIVGSDIVMAHGGLVKSLNFIEGISSTQIINKIKTL